MTVYEVLDQLAGEAEKTIEKYTREIHNAPYMEYGPGSDMHSSIVVYNMMIEQFTVRARALRSAMMALPLDVAESEV